MPPSQWVVALQRSKALGISSILVRMLAPVVVNPLMVSKSASINEGIYPDKKKGRAPKREEVIQLSVTKRKPSLFVK